MSPAEKDSQNPNLSPAQFEVNQFRRSKINQDKPTTTPDQFGQQYTSDYDRSKWSSDSPVDSRKDHTRADTDMSPRSLHHTLGSKHNQASPGDHIHDGIQSRKLGKFIPNPSFNPALPVSPTNVQYIPELTCANTTDSIRALLHHFIEFRDV